MPRRKSRSPRPRGARFRSARPGTPPDPRLAALFDFVNFQTVLMELRSVAAVIQSVDAPNGIDLLATLDMLEKEDLLRPFHDVRE
jgi:hypothetical protein